MAKRVISVPLATIFNQSICSGIFPSKLKCAKIIPIFKDEDDTLPENYRPISLLSIYNRIVEKLMYSRVTKFVKDCSILYDQQYGFRSKHSTQHAILDTVNTILQNMDNGKFSCDVFIDLKKAFDTVNHELLLAKLENYGIRGVINSWFRSYLTDRKQTTEVNNVVSEAATTFCGVPQGSVLGPLVFLLYINDIYKSSSLFSFYLFADDASIILANNNLKELETLINRELGNVNEWLKANKLSLDIKKSNFVIFRPRQKNGPFIPSIRILDSVTNTYANLEMKEYVKYLGLSLIQIFHGNTTSIYLSQNQQVDRNYTLCPASCFTFSLQLINCPLLDLWYLWLGKLCLDISKKDRNSTKTGLTSHLLQ